MLNLPLGDILWGVTLLGEFVVDESELAALLTGRDSVQADVELGAVVRVGVPVTFVLYFHGICICMIFGWFDCQAKRILSPYLGWGSNCPNSSVGAFSGQVNPLLVSEMMLIVCCREQCL